MIDFVLFAIAYVAIIALVTLALNKEWVKLEKALKALAGFIFEIVYELGKGAVVAGLIGAYLIPESKDFAMAIKYGIIFYAVGYSLKK